MPDAGPAVVVDDVSKRFRLPTERMHTLKERALHPLRSRRFEVLHALRDVSVEVRPGEFFGIVGRNGSGKSTLLKCLAGIYRVDGGRILLRGRLAPFIELGVGFNPELTARDNVLINGVMLGLTPAEARRRYDAVIEFAELERFQDMKLKNYSSGMQVRLAFAVMAQVDADILLIDEVLAVGDAAFQQKCHEALSAMRREGRTILFVTHDMHTVEGACDRAMLLEEGRCVAIDDPSTVARLYNEANFRGGPTARAERGTAARGGSAAVVDAWFGDEGDARTPTLESGRPAFFHLVVEAKKRLESQVLGLIIADELERRLFTLTVPWEGELAAGERAELLVRFENVLAPGSYRASPVIADDPAGLELEVVDLRHEAVAVQVTGEPQAGGMIALPHEATVRTGAESPAAR
jgi:ABC-type polysaccharide/polyol phosphate transport system ATPase subunit